MRQFLILILLLAFGIASTPVLRADNTDPSDLFLNAYMSVQKAQKLEESGKYKQALQTYKFAASLLEQIRDKSPEWQPVIVNYRLGKTSEAIALIQKRMDVMGPGPTDTEPPPLPTNDGGGDNNTTASTGNSSAPGVVTPGGNSGDTSSSDDSDLKRFGAKYDEIKRQLDDYKKKYAEAKAQNDELNQKYKDTLAQLDKARVDEAQTQAQLQQAEDKYKEAVAGNTRDAQGQKELKDEIARLQNELKDRDAERDALQEENDDAQTKIATLGAARDSAVDALNKAKAGQEQIDKLMAENADLNKKLSAAQQTIADLNAGNPAKDAEIAGLKKDLADARERLDDALKQSQENLNAMHDLQNQLETATSDLSLAKTGGAAPSSEEAQKLTDENKLLRGIVRRERNAEAYRDQQKQLILAQLAQLQLPADSPLAQEMANVTEPVKLTEEERRLFKQTEISISEDNTVSLIAEKPVPPAAAASPSPAPSPAQAGPTPAPAATPQPMAVSTPPPAAVASPSPTPAPASAGQNMPPSATAPPLPSNSAAPAVQTTFMPPVPDALAPQAKEAKEQFESGHYREAEKIYRAMMEQEPKNLYILDNLGVVLFRSGKLKDAEQILRKAIAVTPDDEFSLRTLGIVLYTEGSFDGDGALSKLTKAVTVNPKDAIARNYLGITASAKGWQEAARKELETAVAIDPNYADAQFNLAVI
ncbi:MAG TPA: tetratricopeptide repeat protein, partial [Chthoniobacteraceae bacterium]|nr:tetratricopeptide repeat protein [Chthoniobacteraceae bacterium]